MSVLNVKKSDKVRLLDELKTLRGEMEARCNEMRAFILPESFEPFWQLAVFAESLVADRIGCAHYKLAWHIRENEWGAKKLPRFGKPICNNEDFVSRIRTKARAYKKSLKNDLFEALKNYSLSELPAKAFTLQALTKKVGIGTPIINLIALQGRFSCIPQKILLDMRLWEVCDEVGDTPLHNAARNNWLTRVPDEIKTRKELWLAKGWYDETPLHCAAKYGYVKQLPSCVFEWQHLWQIPDREGETPKSLFKVSPP